MINIVEKNPEHPFALCEQWDGEEPKPIYLWLLADAHLIASPYEPGKTPVEVHEGREAWWRIPLITAGAANTLMHAVAPLLGGYLTGDETQRADIDDAIQAIIDDIDEEDEIATSTASIFLDWDERGFDAGGNDVDSGDPTIIRLELGEYGTVTSATSDAELAAMATAINRAAEPMRLFGTLSYLESARKACAAAEA